MTKAKSNFCKAAIAVLLSMLLAVSLFGVIGTTRASAEDDRPFNWQWRFNGWYDGENSHHFWVDSTVNALIATKDGEVKVAGISYDYNFTCDLANYGITKFCLQLYGKQVNPDGTEDNSTEVTVSPGGLDSGVYEGEAYHKESEDVSSDPSFITWKTGVATNGYAVELHKNDGAAVLQRTIYRDAAYTKKVGTFKILVTKGDWQNNNNFGDGVDYDANKIDGNITITQNTAAAAGHWALLNLDNNFKNSDGTDNVQNKISANDMVTKFPRTFNYMMFNGRTMPQVYADGVYKPQLHFNHDGAGAIGFIKSRVNGGDTAYAFGDVITVKSGFIPVEKDGSDYKYFTVNGKYWVLKDTVSKIYVGDNKWATYEGIYGIELAKGTALQRIDQGKTFENKATVKNDYEFDGTKADATVQYTSSNPEIATVDNNGVVTAVKASKDPVTITAKVPAVKGYTISTSYQVKVMDPNRTPENAMIDDGKLFMELGTEQIKDPLEQSDDFKVNAYEIEEGDGEEYDYKITLNAYLYNGVRNLTIPVLYGTSANSVDLVAADINSGYLVTDADVTRASDNETVANWVGNVNEYSVAIGANSGEATLTLKADLPASDEDGVFGAVEQNKYHLGEEIKIRIVLEYEDLTTAGHFSGVNKAKKGQACMQFGQRLPNGNVVPYNIAETYAGVGGWNNVEDKTEDHENIPDFLNHIKFSGSFGKNLTYSEYLSATGNKVCFNVRGPELELQQYKGATSQEVEWEDGMHITFEKGLKLVGLYNKHWTYLHDETRQYWVLDADQVFIYSEENKAFSKDAAEIKEVVLDKAVAGVDIGNAIRLTATVNAVLEGYEFHDTTVTWKSSNEAVATVVDGDVTGVAAGTAIITVTAANGMTATCTVTVLDPDAIDSVVVTPATSTLKVDDTVILEATVVCGSNADDSVTWSSSDNTIATVDENGVVTALKAGTVTITATASDGETKGTATITVEKDGGNDEEKPAPAPTKKKCGGNVAASASIAAIALLFAAGVVLVARKRKNA